MHVLVLGGTRFIGLALVRALQAYGHRVLLAHRGEHEPAALAGLPHLHCNRRELSQHREFLQGLALDGVVDTCAMTGPDALAALRALPSGTRRVVLSSVDVYRAFGSVLADTVTDPVPLDETSALREAPLPPRPESTRRGWDYDPEAYDKRAVEQEYLATGAVVCRLPAVFGEHDPQRREEPVLRRVRRRRRVPTGPGNFLFAMGYVGDIAEGIRLALETPGIDGEVFNLGERRTPTVLARYRQLAAAAGVETEFVPVPEGSLPEDLRLTRAIAQHVLVDASKARRVLGWEPSDPEETLRRSVRWHLANPPEAPDDDFTADDRALSAA
jgi:nucleoside-diphosphate-sugar epimerase